MRKVVSEDAVRRGLAKINEAKGLTWLQKHLDYCTAPLLGEPWVLDMDSTVKTLYGHQEGAEVGYNPAKPGRPSHAYHTYMLSSLRLVLRVDVRPGDDYNVAHATDGLWTLLDHLGSDAPAGAAVRRQVLGHRAGDGTDGAERPGLFVSPAYDGKRPPVAGPGDAAFGLGGCRAGLAGQGDDAAVGWMEPPAADHSAAPQAGPRDLAITDRTNPAQPLLGFAEVGPDKAAWEYAALVTSLDNEILTLGQLYRDRADCENVFDELKNQWGWGGFTTQDLARCRLLAGTVALAYNWWSLFVRLADPEHHREALTSRPLLLSAIACRTQHAGQVRLTISSTHGMRDEARRAYVRIAGFLAELRKNAEQLEPLEKWYRILSEALRHFLHGRQLQPPLHISPA
jgi:hypothetical protein